MSDWHPDRETLERFLDDALTEEENRTLQRHLFSCSSCEERLIDILPLTPEGPAHEESPRSAIPIADDDLRYRGLVRQVLRENRQEVEQRKTRLAQERRDAGRLWREIRDLDAATRRDLVWEDRRFQSWGFFELLLDRSRTLVLEEPAKTEQMLRLALDVAEHLDPATYGPGSIGSAKARAWAYLGNALRVLSDFRQSEQAFRQAESYLCESWLDPLDEALLLELKASLRRAQQRFHEALGMLDAAIDLYREVNEPHLQGRATLAKGLVLRYDGRFEEAGACFRNSLFLLDGAEEPRLLVGAQYNLIGCLQESGRAKEAGALIPETRRLMEEVAHRFDLLRLRWLEGRIAAALGQLDEAEQAFLEVSEAFIEDRIAFDAALVSLDLAALYAREGRTAEVKRLATETLPIFQSCDIHREAIAALIVFQNAAEMEQLSLGLVEEVSSFLQRVRTNPNLRFRGQEGEGLAH
jgi:tetratricopeptide (TPR) repeat protein